MMNYKDDVPDYRETKAACVSWFIRTPDTQLMIRLESSSLGYFLV